VEALVLELDAESGPAPGPAGPFAS
jgi:hypothetical protein